MKAAIYEVYGPPDVVRIAEVQKPVPKDDEVLIKVRAASVNPLDWRIMKGEPRLLRLFFGLRKPKRGRPGVDVSGEVEAVGGKVSQFKPGDAVFGAAPSAIAEFTCTRESKIAMKPEQVTFEQAASTNVAGLTAVQGLRKGKIQSGSQVLINGAAGGVGTFAVQLAKSFGAQVTSVCSTRNVELVKSIGADVVIDYTHDDFTKSDQRYDLILDCVGNHSFSDCKRVLTPHGRFVMVGGPHDAKTMDVLSAITKGVWLSLFRNQKAVMFIGKASPADLTFIADLIVSGKLTPVIEKKYPLSEAAAAIKHVEEGHARGKVVITV